MDIIYQNDAPSAMQFPDNGVPAARWHVLLHAGCILRTASLTIREKTFRRDPILLSPSPVYSVPLGVLARDVVGSGTPNPLSTFKGRFTVWARPGRLGAGICFDTSTIKTPPARMSGKRWPACSHRCPIFNQNRLDDGGW
jgi:hypothetical protein